MNSRRNHVRNFAHMNDCSVQCAIGTKNPETTVHGVHVLVYMMNEEHDKNCNSLIQVSSCKQTSVQTNPSTCVHVEIIRLTLFQA